MPIEITIILTHGHSWLAASLLSEPWRVANRLAGQQLLIWRFTSWEGAPVPASNGLVLPLDGPASEAFQKPALAVVVAGDAPDKAADPRLLSWLRKMDRLGVMIGGIDTGPELLAEAGLLGDHPPALHHEAVPQFRERHLGLGLSFGLYSIEGNRATCAGGIATLDFSLALLSRFTSESLAQQTAAALIYGRRAPEIGAEADLQGSGSSWMDPRLARAVAHLSSIDRQQESGIAGAAAAAGLSERQLTRLFKQGLGCTPGAFAARTRIRRARNLLEETGLPIGEIALACGYAGQAEFARAWRRETGSSPLEHRRRSREKHPTEACPQ